MIAILFVFLLLYLPCQYNEWKGIKVLKSTRADVERILGKPEAGSVARDAAFYQTNDERVFVQYSHGSCDTPSNSGWHVPDLTVTNISVHPNVRPQFADFAFDRAAYERRPDPHIIHLVEYVSRKEGKVVVVDTEKGVVETIDYFPREQDSFMKCSADPTKRKS